MHILSPASGKRPKQRREPVQAAASAADHRAILARHLDVLADCELQHGHHLMAEHLARQAQALREAGR